MSNGSDSTMASANDFVVEEREGFSINIDTGEPQKLVSIDTREPQRLSVRLDSANKLQQPAFGESETPWRSEATTNTVSHTSAHSEPVDPGTPDARHAGLKRAPSALARAMSRDLARSVSKELSKGMSRSMSKDMVKALAQLEDEAPESPKRVYSMSSAQSRVRTASINTDYNVEESPFNMGSVGITYLGRPKSRPKEKVAIKMVPTGNYEQGEANVANLVTSQKLTHPNIVNLLDVVLDEDAGKVFFVMEMYSGFDLQYLISDAKRERLANPEGRSRFHERTLARFAYEMVSGIAYCHRKRICHRDIRPENYLLKYWPKSYTAPSAPLKLMDFGLATIFDPGVPMHTCCGIIYQASPQMLRQCYTEKCDIWSIGITLYRLTCLGTPFWNDDVVTMFELVCEGPDVNESFEEHKEHWSKLGFDPSGPQRLIKEMLCVNEDVRPSAEDLLYGSGWIAKRCKAKENDGQCCTVS